MKDYLVLGLMPFFPVRAYDVDRFNPEEIFGEFIRGLRDYGKFQLRPIGVQYQPSRSVWDGWSTSPRENDLACVSARQSIYHLAIADDALAEEDVTDCLIGVQALMYDFVPEDYTLVPIEPSEIPASRVIPMELAVDMYCRKLGLHADYDEHSKLLATKHTRGYEWDERLWGSIGYVMGDEQVVYALLFLRAAFEHLMFYGDEFENAIRFQKAKAHRIKEAVDIENSIHNCYKVMEAVYGGTLANDWQQVERVFQQRGVDLQQLGGFTTQWGKSGEEPLIEKLKKLKWARDDRAAHGRIHANRRSTYYELLDYQMLASITLRAYVKYKYPAAPL
jgi:hypothetical protein